MHKRRSLVSTLLLGSALLLGNGLSSSVAQGKAIAEMSPKSGWSVSRVDGNASTAESYCALSRQYDQGLVVTLGRNETEEYSLAIDFQSAKLNTEKAYSLTLQPGPGQIRAYEMMPASQRAMVVRLGYDESFFNALQSSSLLKVDLDGTNYHFKMPNFSTGKADLNNCLAGLKGKKKTKVASGFSAEKVADAAPIKVKKIDAPKFVEAIKVEPKPAPVVEAVEPLQVAKVAPKIKRPTKSVAIEKIGSVPAASPKPIEITRVKTKQVVSKDTNVATLIASEPVIAPEPVIIREGIKAPKVEKPVSTLAEIKPIKNIVRSNNDSLLKDTLVNSQVSKRVISKPSAPLSVGRTSLQKRQRDAMAQLKADNERLNKALRAEVSKPAIRTPNPVDIQLKEDVDKLKEENQQLKLSMQAQEKKQAQVTKLSQEKIKQAMAIQEREKQAEAKKLAEAAVSKASKKAETQQKIAAVNPQVMRQLDDLKADNMRLSAALQGKGALSQAPDSKSDLAAIRSQLQELKVENKKIYEQSRLTRGNVDTAVAATSNQALRKMSEYEKKLAASKNDNLALSKEIEELRRMQEDGRLSGVAGDWDLEKSTKRYNEAEREIKRLGMLLEQQRMAHRQEKSDLENMLFDPAVTEHEQRRRLGEMELQLAEAERELQKSGRALPQRQRASLSPVEERVTLGRMTPESVNPIVAQQRENLEIQRLNNKVARQNQQLQAYNNAQKSERMAAVPRAVVRRESLAPPRAVTPRLPAPTLVEPPQAKRQPQRQSQAVSRNVPKAPAAAASVRATGFDKGNLQQLLNSAGVSLSGGVTKQGTGRYRWSAGNLVGQAQVVPKAQAGGIDQFAQNYIAKAKQSCGGDFASLPSTTSGQGKGFEIACISASRSTSSSVIFVQKGNDLIAISHEASAENMDLAMDARDRIAGKL